MSHKNVKDFRRRANICLYSRLLAAGTAIFAVLSIVLRMFIEMWSLGKYIPFNYDPITAYAFIIAILLAIASTLVTMVILRCPVCGGLMGEWKYKRRGFSRRGAMNLIPNLNPTKCTHCSAPLCHELVKFSQCSCGEKVPGESQYCLKCGEDQWNK